MQYIVGPLREQLQEYQYKPVASFMFWSFAQFSTAHVREQK